MNSTKKQARTAGLLYLFLGITARIGLEYVPGKLFVPGDATATASHILASQSLLRIGIGSELFPPDHWSLSGSGSLPIIQGGE